MINGIQNLIRNLRNMPSPLSGFTVVLWLSGAAFAVGSLIPGWKDRVTGREIPHRELWGQFDGGPAIFLTGCGLFGLGYVVYRGWSWVRHALMFGLIVIATSGFFSPDYRDVPIWILVAVASIAIGFGVRYLYFRRQVIAYFETKS
jgi:hypothetical protein